MSSVSSQHSAFVIWIRRGLHNPADTGPLHRRGIKILGISAISLGLLAFAAIAILVFSGISMTADGADHGLFVANRSAFATAIFTVITEVSAPTVLPLIVIALAVFWAVWRKQLWRPLLLAGAMVVTVLLTFVIKSVITHNRPPVAEMLLGPDDNHSFPSGHTLVATVFFLVLAYLLLSRGSSRLRTSIGIALAALGIFAVAISRLYLGYHGESPRCVRRLSCLRGSGHGRENYDTVSAGVEGSYGAHGGGDGGCVFGVGGDAKSCPAFGCGCAGNGA